MQEPSVPPPPSRSIEAIQRDQKRVSRMRMLCKFVLFCLAHGHGIFTWATRIALILEKLAPTIAKILARVA